MFHIVNENSFKQTLQNIHNLSHDNTYIILSDKFGQNNEQVASHVLYRSLDSYAELFTPSTSIKIIDIQPMFYLLNTTHAINWLPPTHYINKIIKKLEIIFAPLLYILDGFLLSDKRSNIKLLVAQKIPYNVN